MTLPPRNDNARSEPESWQLSCLISVRPFFCVFLCVCVFFLLKTMFGVHFPIVYSVQGYFLYFIQCAELILILYTVCKDTSYIVYSVQIYFLYCIQCAELPPLLYTVCRVTSNTVSSSPSYC